jgi:predicted transcriptional regulator
MGVSDIMVSPVITVKPQDSIKKVAQLFVQQGISAAPVIDDQGKVVGIISEGDLLHARKSAPNGSVRDGSGSSSGITNSPTNSLSRTL